MSPFDHEPFPFDKDLFGSSTRVVNELCDPFVECEDLNIDENLVFIADDFESEENVDALEGLDIVCMKV